MAALSTVSLVTCFTFLLALRGADAAGRNGSVSGFSLRDFPWRPSQNRTLSSPNGRFAAGFLPASAACRDSAPPSPNRYVFAVWVSAAADRAVMWSLPCSRPVVASAPLVVVSPSRGLSLNDSSGRNIWPEPRGGPNATELELGDGGALVFGNWSSFDHPTDTALTGQALQNRKMTSSNGRYQFVNGTSLLFNGSDMYWNTSTILFLTADGALLRADGQLSVMADVKDRSLRRLTLDPDGNLHVYSLDNRTGSWSSVWQAVQEPCRIYGTCGANAICYSNGSSLTEVSCVCPPGFRWSPRGGGGCEPKSAARAGSGKFLRLDFVSFNDGAAGPTVALTLGDCQSRCSRNTSCAAFSYKFTGRQECNQYTAPLANGFWSPSTEMATYLRVAETESASSNFTGMLGVMATVCPVLVRLPFPPKESRTTARNLGIISAIFALELLAGVGAFWAFLRRYSKYRDMARVLGLEFLPAGGPKRFSYAELKSATKDFGEPLGQGGFGVVYKGELPDRRVVAVKRLRGVTGSEADFWAEVTIIARMHHLNLVRLWGFCAERDQRLLVHEYVPNGSLDRYLFPAHHTGDQLGTVDEEEEEEAEEEEEEGNLEGSAVAIGGGRCGRRRRRAMLLDWGIRYRIAVGVARAIAYLHEECLEWVLHRDIKPENILLDGDFCPKVADFGLAKLTTGGKGGGGEERVSRSGVGPRGTRGYMAPEWVMPREAITAKADVYSFGMVLLEMVTGSRGSVCRRASVASEEWYLPHFAYEKVYLEKNVEELLDQRMVRSYDTRAHAAMVERMVKTAVWCLQGRPELRPSMGKVAKMLEGTVEITEPGKPTIFYLRDTPGAKSARSLEGEGNHSYIID